MSLKSDSYYFFLIRSFFKVSLILSIYNYIYIICIVYWINIKINYILISKLNILNFIKKLKLVLKRKIENIDENNKRLSIYTYI